MQILKNKKFKFLSVFIAVSLVMTMLLTGCQKDGKPDASTKVIKQELVIGEQYDLVSYNPSKNMSDFVRALVFNSLVEINMDFKKVPGLAESWTMSPDGKTWTFQLRKDVVFHDGTPWNSEAASINLKWLAKGTGKNTLSAVESIETPDQDTLVIKLKKPVFTFDSDITPPFMSMVSPKAIDEKGDVSAAIGTGPFKLVSWQKDSDYVMERNEQYFAGAPKLTKLTFKVIPDAESRAMALEAGQIDLMSGREALTAVQRLKNNPDLKLVKQMGQTSELMFFNVYQAPFDDLKVRQAVASAINLDEMVEKLIGDLAEPPVNFFSPAFGKFLNPDPRMPKYDLQASKTLLAEAGWKDSDGDGILEKSSNKLKATLTYGSNNAEDKILCTALQGALKEIGMDVELRPVDTAALRQALEKKDYQMIMIGQWFVPHDDPSMHYINGYWHSKSTYTVFTSPELDSKIDKLAASLDAQDRIKLHQDIQAEILENTPEVVIFHRNNVLVMKKSIENLNPSVGTWQIFRGLTQAEIK